LLTIRAVRSAGAKVCLVRNSSCQNGSEATNTSRRRSPAGVTVPSPKPLIVTKPASPDGVKYAVAWPLVSETAKAGLNVPNSTGSAAKEKVCPATGEGLPKTSISWAIIFTGEVRSLRLLASLIFQPTGESAMDVRLRNSWSLSKSWGKTSRVRLSITTEQVMKSGPDPVACKIAVATPSALVEVEASAKDALPGESGVTEKMTGISGMLL